MAIATGAAIALAVAAGTAGSGIYAAKKQSDSADKAADLTTTTANHAADLTAKSNADALDFQKQQAENAYQNSELARKANYDQWAAGERRKQSVNDLLGMGPRSIPDYVPGVDPRLSGGTPAPAAPAVGTLAGAPVTPPPASPAPANGDWRGAFESITGGKPLDQKGLLALAPQLQQAGFKITPPSAAGVVSKIGLPDGSWVRVLNGDTSVASPTVWVPQPSSAGQVAPGTTNVGSVGSYLQPAYAQPRTAALAIPKPVGSYL